VKTKLIIPLLLALVVTLIPVSAVFAYEPWDVEDPCEFSHEDFALASGYDAETQTTVTHKGEHFPGKPPSDGYSHYRDDTTNSGDLDEIDVLLPRPNPGFIHIGLQSPNTWYWATEPRGYNLPLVVTPANESYNRYKGLSGVFWVEVFNFSGFDTYKWDDWGSFDRVLAEPVVAYNKVNGLICTLYIPEGTHLSYPNRPYTLVTNLFVEKDDDGGIYFEPGNLDFSQPCFLKLAHSDGTEEVVTFTQIRDGLPVE